MANNLVNVAERKRSFSLCRSCTLLPAHCAPLSRGHRAMPSRRLDRDLGPGCGGHSSEWTGAPSEANGQVDGGQDWGQEDQYEEDPIQDRLDARHPARAGGRNPLTSDGATAAAL